jgi:hypothetical protein
MGTHSYTVGVSFVLGAPAIHRLRLPRRIAKDMRGAKWFKWIICAPGEYFPVALVSGAASCFR